MKKLLIILSLALIGCTTNTKRNIISLEKNYDTIIIEECEYLIYYNVGTAGFMAHKGNCKNH